MAPSKHPDRDGSLSRQQSERLVAPLDVSVAGRPKGRSALAGAEQAHDGADCSSCGKASVSSRRSTSVSLVVPSVSGAAPHDLCRIGLAKQKRTVVKRGARIRSEAAGRTLAGLASALVVGGLLVVSPSRCG